MPYSLTYLAVFALTFMGIENAEQVVDAAMIIIVALIALFGRYRAGGTNIFGVKK